MIQAEGYDFTGKRVFVSGPVTEEPNALFCPNCGARVKEGGE